MIAANEDKKKSIIVTQAIQKYTHEKNNERTNDQRKSNVQRTMSLALLDWNKVICNLNTFEYRIISESCIGWKLRCDHLAASSKTVKQSIINEL